MSPKEEFDLWLNEELTEDEEWFADGRDGTEKSLAIGFYAGFQAALSSRDSTPTEGGDRALAAPRMTLDLREVARFNESDGPFWRRLEVLERIRAQLPNVEIITEES